MACKDYVLFRNCSRRNCSRPHDYMFCVCRNNEECTFFHVQRNDLDDLKNYRRPFRYHLIKEIDRVASIYKNLYGENKTKICTRLLTGLKKCREECITCTKLEQPRSVCKYIYSYVLKLEKNLILFVLN